MRIRNLMLISIGALALVACQEKKKVMKQEQKPIDVTNLDQTANPGKNFNIYANGGWKAKNPIPDDKSRNGTFDILGDENDKKLKELIAEISTSTHEKGSVSEKIAIFYNSGMDTAKIEKEGYSVIKPYLEQIDKVSSVDELQLLIHDFHKKSNSAGFILYGSADSKNSSMVITHLYQGGIGLPDKDYYLSEAPRFTEIREKYVTHIANMFKLIDTKEEDAKSYASKIMEMETRFATASMDRLSLRDPHKTYNKKTVEELANETKNFDWRAYFKAMNLGDIKELIVSQPDFIAEFDKMLVDIPLDTWKVYLKWHFITGVASYLDDNFVNEDFDFFGKVLSGTPQIKPRWKRVQGKTGSALSEAVGRAYVEKYFPPEAKARMLKLVANLRLALGERIANLEWMSDETKINAKEKLDAINVKIGYPDKWKDYSELDVKEDAYVLNVIRAREFGHNEMISKIDKPVDKAEWHMPPQMVNAYYSPNMNEIVFPAAILQPPFFFLDGDDAVNYGAIGVVIGHEMTHGFDDKGRLYDKEGNLNTWWTEEDAKRFTERADVLVKQFDEFIVLDTIHANGSYTLGENIADLGGLNISYTAFKKTEQWKNQENKIDGFTPDQRFFLAYSHVWAQNIRDKEALRRVQEDVHSLGEHRVNGPLRNLPEFHKAFDIKEGDYMYLPENKRAIIW